MEFNASELNMIGFALRTQPGGHGVQNFSVREIPLEKLRIASDILEKIMKFTEGEDRAKKFIDGSIDLSTEEKAYILELLKRSWDVESGKVYFSLFEKLNK